MRRLFFLQLLALLLIACQNDTYDQGNGENSLLQADFVEAHVGTGCVADYVVTDDNVRLPLQPQVKASWMTKEDTVYRAALYYKMNGEAAEPVRLTKVNVAAITPRDSLKEGMKTDPLTLESVWLSKNKRYLNVGFYVKSGSTDDEKASHLLGVVEDTLIAYGDGTRTLGLKLYHDQGGMPEYYSVHSYFSVAMKGLSVDSIRFFVNTYKGEVTKTISVR